MVAGLFEDAMISMTYARNLVDGFGLNWARYGAPVEGFTHPLWLVLMVGANLMPVAPALRGFFVQGASLTFLLAMTLVSVHLARRYYAPASKWAWLLVAIPVAFDRSVTFWSLVGLESGLQALLVLLAFSLALAITEDSQRRQLALFALLGACCLLRLDMLPFAALLALYVLRHGPREHLRSWLYGFGLFTLMLAAYEGFRLVYFREWLPNTYYLKLYRVPIAIRALRGLDVVGSSLVSLSLPLLLGAVALLTARTRAVRLALTIFAVYAAYAVYVGGDAFESLTRVDRFMNFTLPLLFLAGAAALDSMLATLERRLASTMGVLAFFLALGGAMAITIVENGLGSAAGLSSYVLGDTPLFVKREARVLDRLDRLRPWLAPDAVVATHWAGYPAYFTDYRLIDILGYNDRVIARRPLTTTFTRANYLDYLPGHEKWDYEEVFARRPDAFFSVWGLSRSETERLMAAHGYVDRDDFWLAPHSPAVNWHAAAETPISATVSGRLPTSGRR
jgi:hypothetical protein